MRSKNTDPSAFCALRAILSISIASLLSAISPLASPLAAAGEAPAVEWAKNLGGSHNDLANQVLQTADGGYVIAGSSYSTDGDVKGNRGEEDCWVAKLDARGSLEWQRSLGGSARDQAFSIALTSDGGYIVAGSSESRDGDVGYNQGAQDFWVAKLSAAGDLEWERSLGGSGPDQANSVAQAPVGGYIVAGSSYSSDGDVSGPHGGSDFWVAKLSAEGDTEWEKSLGGSGRDFAESVAPTSDGGYIVAGYSDSTDGDVRGNHGKEDLWVAKLSANGALEWQKSLGGSSYEQAHSIAQTSDGGYLVAGASESTDGDVKGNHGKEDLFVAKLSPKGALEWQRSLGGSQSETAYSVIQTSDGGFAVAGFSSSADGDAPGDRLSKDFWVARLSAQGALEWQKGLGGGFLDEARSIVETADGGYVVAGESESSDGDITDNHGSSDFWVVKLSPPAGR
jgi:uncharacterized delta-60 repeat protein